MYIYICCEYTSECQQAPELSLPIHCTAHCPTGLEAGNPGTPPSCGQLRVQGIFRLIAPKNAGDLCTTQPWKQPHSTALTWALYGFPQSTTPSAHGCAWSTSVVVHVHRCFRACNFFIAAVVNRFLIICHIKHRRCRVLLEMVSGFCWCPMRYVQASSAHTRPSPM